MKISMRNFGPLREFEIDLDADFTLIVGENNIGKSYAISLLYSALKTLLTNNLVGRPFFGDIFFERMSEKKESVAREDFSKSYRSSKKDIDITDYVKSLTKSLVGVFFVDQFEKTIEGTFGEISNLENRRDNGDTLICIETPPLSIELLIKNNCLAVKEIRIPTNFIYRKSKQHRNPKTSPDNTVVYGPSDDIEPAEARIYYAAYNIFSDFAQEVASAISDIHYLPASRSGLYQALSAFGQIIAELSKRRTFLSQRIELPAISEPLVDYFLKLNEIRPSRKGAEGNYNLIAEELEKNVLGGAVEFDQKTKKLFYKPFGTDLKLDLSSTSSMVSEVAPIVTYLKHVLPESEQRKGSRRHTRTRLADAPRRKQMIFIEEPEAHLHPRTQVLLMDAFARLVKIADVKIIMTSHSNFVFNKISNLVMSGSFGDAKVEAFRFIRSETGTTSQILDVDESGITDENFSEVAEDLFSEKIQLIEGNMCNTGMPHDIK